MQIRMLEWYSLSTINVSAVALLIWLMQQWALSTTVHFSQGKPQIGLKPDNGSESECVSDLKMKVKSNMQIR